MSLSPTSILMSSAYELTWHFAYILVDRLCITEIVLVLILNPGELHKLFLYIRKSVYEVYYCYQFLQFQQIEYSLIKKDFNTPLTP